MIAVVLFAVAIFSIAATVEADEAAIGPCISGLCPDGYECKDQSCVKSQTTEDITQKSGEQMGSV
uniref:Uncharacterized protein n=1 Tax=Parascaris univalens TaxID=6257 RepID=A0A915AAT2_PARUN